MFPVWDVVSSFDSIDKKVMSRSFSDQALPSQWVNKYPVAPFLIWSPISPAHSYPSEWNLSSKFKERLTFIGSFALENSNKAEHHYYYKLYYFFFFNRQILVKPGIKTFQWLGHGDQYKITSKLLIQKNYLLIYSVCLWVHESVIEGKIKLFGRFPHNLV